MSNNIKTYLLLGVVLLVWGIIGFKLIKALSKEPELPMVQQPISALPKSIKKRDTFELMANYRDPFLGTLPATKKKAVKRAVKKEPVSKRNIIYSGLVAQTGSGNTMFFVTIEGQQYIMSKSEEINGVRLLNGNGQSIKVRYDGRTETIVLQ
ncbi:hypothetical protein [Allomuricauda sp. F6463D]|uniref:hypothetical protein n=1 Tax=Allomuricauda sp. F6463D TaxID=2926409 RepID=UPI001FF6B360|nr:hypothetical protein [Muricauda sp. F6463D]MCK0160129.1 hypothetical protein [Muricauda sp. F6463D]